MTTAPADVVLAVFAHPDDESLAVGGTLARLASEGYHVVVMCASHGERGSEVGPVRDDALGRIRATELMTAARALGIAEVILWHHPDGDLRWAEVTDFHAELILFLRRRRPSAVITFDEDGLYWHADHIGVYERVLTAVQSLGPEAPPLYLATMARGRMPAVVNTAKSRGWVAPAKGFWSLVPEAFGLAAEPHTLESHVEAWVPRKVAALLAHQSQVRTGHPFEQCTPDDLRTLFGLEQFRRAAIDGRPGRLLEDRCTEIS